MFFYPLLLLQSNEVNGSSAMEFEGFLRGMGYLFGVGLTVATFISDRHLSIAKHMREKLPNIRHYFDLWHLKKSKSDQLNNLSSHIHCKYIHIHKIQYIVQYS